MHMVKKFKIQVWGGPHGVTKRLNLRVEPHMITFNPVEHLNIDALSSSQKRALLAHLCGNKDCCKKIEKVEWCYDYC